MASTNRTNPNRSHGKAADAAPAAEKNKMSAADAADAAQAMHSTSPVGVDDDWDEGEDEFFADGRKGSIHEGRDLSDRDLDEEDLHEDDAPWMSAMQLEAPEPLPGYVQRWIRATAFGSTDRSNLHKRARQGWHPRPLDSIDEKFMPYGIDKDAGKDGVLSVGGMILCQREQALHERHARAVRQRTRDLKGSVARNLNQVEVPSTPFSQQSKSEITFGRRPRLVS